MPSPSLAGKTVFITGASRGIGKAIGLRAAADGANVVIAAKSAEPNPKLPGTIYSAAEEMEEAGGRALPLQVDIRFEEQVVGAMAKAVETFGGLDVLVNNASAIYRDRLSRGTYLCSRAAIPHLAEAENPHILNLSPPLDRETSWHPKWFAPHVAYTMSKYGMSLCVLGMAAELRDRGVAVNALWPRTVIATAALAMLGGAVKPEQTRKPEILADAAHAILTRPSRECTGNFFVDDELLAEEGVTDLDRYAVSPGTPLYPDFFVEPAG